jgi:hypothetical protein
MRQWIVWIVLVAGCQASKPLAYRAELKGDIDDRGQETVSVTVTFGNGG